jgi:radical SAM superfamily enzyme YgiQ (UPF0313 family)
MDKQAVQGKTERKICFSVFLFSMKILAVNPWVHDFAYHDLYAKPYGLLVLSSLLRRIGHNVTFIDFVAGNGFPDCGMKRKKDGTAAFFREEIKMDKAYDKIKRNYYRFGMPPSEAGKMLEREPAPDAILVTSVMTYWYGGVKETIQFLKSFFPGVPVYLGGVYATLLHEHAVRYSGADHVFRGDAGIFVKTIFKAQPFNNHALPDLHVFYTNLNYIPILTATGCPFNCAYCASKLLSGGLRFIPVNQCVEYIEKYTAFFKTDIVAFYDDALLYKKEEHMYPLLAGTVKRGLKLKFYTPNGLHVKFIDEECARILRLSGFQKLRLSLEFTEDSLFEQFGDKTNKKEFEIAVNHLRQAGFSSGDIGVYLLCGLFGQKKEDIKKSIDYVYNCGATPYLSEYSPVPGSALFAQDRINSQFDLSEPLYHNNTILPMQNRDFTYVDFLEMKKYNRSKRMNFVDYD